MNEEKLRREKQKEMIKMWTVLEIKFDMKEVDKNISKLGKLLKSFEEFGVSTCEIAVKLETIQDLRNKEVVKIKKNEDSNTV